MSDFNDRPLVAGSVTGLRAFKVDSLGRLLGVTQGGVFTPGENVGTCKSDARLFRGLPKGCEITRSSLYLSTSFATTTNWPTKLYVTFPDGHSETFNTARDVAEAYPPPADEPHQIGAKGCGCGFYAYFDGRNDYHLSTSWGPTVAAVVEGYGVCTVGDRGFRAEKARLVALVRESKAEPEPEPEAESVHWRVSLAKKRKRHEPYQSFGFQPERQQPVSDERWALVVRNYPDVPVYPSIKAALAAHPLTPPEPEPAPSPETRPDFWSMAVPS